MKKKINKIKKKEKSIYKFGELFSLFFSIWCIDFLTTIIALNFSLFEGKFVEVNPIANWFFSLGLIGWVIAFLYSLSIIALVSFLLIKLINIPKNENTKLSLWLLSIITFMVIEINIIWGNMTLMIGNL